MEGRLFWRMLQEDLNVDGKNCAGFQVREVVKNGSLFDVFRLSRGASEPDSNRLLNVREQTCECGKWQERGVTYIDAVAYYRLFGMQTLQYMMDNHDSQRTLPVRNSEQTLEGKHYSCFFGCVLDQDGVTLPPNPTKQASGRPRKDGSGNDLVLPLIQTNLLLL
ncbi:hypothetical protein IV203_003277 [Nitzschia inconspicua]|uniref:Uncharacterized protein n=1 Tax=Nitzschia inconspicua TaxID=303405 RepID=A0A9K3PP42_9STRA|nr:hypothetical protein IV203_003277 [Nitzschia inconspicua]